MFCSTASLNGRTEEKHRRGFGIFKRPRIHKTYRISLYGSDDTDRVLEEPVFDAVQVPVNIFDLRLVRSGALERLRQKGMIVFVRSIYLQGLLFLEPEELSGKLTQAKPYIEKLRALCSKEQRR